MSSTDSNPILEPPTSLAPAPRLWVLSGTSKTFLSLVLAHTLIDMTTGIWPIFKKLAALDLGTAGLISTVATASAMASQPLFGHWSQRGLQRRFLLLGCVLACLSMLLGPIGRNQQGLGPWASNALLLVVFTIVLFGAAMFHPPGVSLAGNSARRQRSLLVSVFIAAGMVGLAFSQLLFSWVYERTGGHTEYLLLPLGLLVWWITRWCRPHVVGNGPHIRLRDLSASLAGARRHLLLLFLILTFMAGLNYGLVFLLPEFVEGHGYPRWYVHGGASMLMILGGVATMIPAGHLADRWGRRGMLLLMLLATCAGYFILVLSPTLPLGAFVLVCLAAGGVLATVNPLGVALAQHMAPRQEGIISGVMMGLAWSVGSLTPMIVGHLAQYPRIGVTGALAWLGFIGIAALGLALFLPREASGPGADPQPAQGS